MFKQMEYFDCVRVIVICVLCIATKHVAGQNWSSYRIPIPNATALSPVGFRISIPDVHGIRLFAFHGSLNRDVSRSVPGDYNYETRESVNGEWVYENNRQHLRHGDVLHSWVYVQHGNQGYRLENLRYTYPEQFGLAYASDPYSTQQNAVNHNGVYVHEQNASPDQLSTTNRKTLRPTTRPVVPPSGTNDVPQTEDNRWINANGNSNGNGNGEQCERSVTFVNGKRIECKQTLIFEETFNGRIDERWSADARMPLESEDAEFVIYRNYPSIWNVTNGKLYIFPKLLQETPEASINVNQIRSGHLDVDSSECSWLLDQDQECERRAGFQRILPPIVTAKLRTKKSFNFKYGRVEIRAKLPKGDWLFPQLLLEPTNNTYHGSGYLPFLNGLVRIAFIRGNEQWVDRYSTLDGRMLFGSTIVTPGDHNRGFESKKIGREHYGNQFHVYSVTWTPTAIQFYVDGTEYGIDNGSYKHLTTIRNAAYWEHGGQMAPFDQEFHISLGVAAAGNADFPDHIINGHGEILNQKPWINTDPKAELNFYLNASKWHHTWNPHESGLIVDYVRVYSV